MTSLLQKFIAKSGLVKLEDIFFFLFLSFPQNKVSVPWLSLNSLVQVILQPEFPEAAVTTLLNLPGLPSE